MNTRLAVILLLLCIAGTAHARIDLNVLRSLFEAGQSKQAYEYAAAEVAVYEGDPDFDFYYGIAAIDTGHASEGVFALERVLLSQPNNHLARLELARGYFILEEYARARREFETVLEVDPPEDVTSRIYNYLDAIRLQEGRYTTTQTAYIQLGAGSDSNINSGPDIDSITFGSLTVPLDVTSRELDDNFSELTARYAINTPVTPGTSFFASINGNARKHSDFGLFDTSTYTANTGFQFLHAKNSYSVDITAQQFNLDDDEYRFLTGVNTNWRHHVSQQTSIQTFLQLARHDYEGQPTRDASAVILGTGFSSRFNVALSPVLFASLYLAQDDPKSDADVAKQNTERDYYGARIGTVLGVSTKSSLQATVNYQTSEYAQADPLTTLIREDDYINVALDYTWLIDRNWSLLVSASSTQNDSSNTLYEYDRTQFSLNVRYEMK